jgi:hypothetical protein
MYFTKARNETIKTKSVLNALAGPTNEKITFKKVESCCPFPQKQIYGCRFSRCLQVVWKGQKKPVRLYINIFTRSFTCTCRIDNKKIISRTTKP